MFTVLRCRSKPLGQVPRETSAVLSSPLRPKKKQVLLIAGITPNQGRNGAAAPRGFAVCLLVRADSRGAGFQPAETTGRLEACPTARCFLRSCLPRCVE